MSHLAIKYSNLMRNLATLIHGSTGLPGNDTNKFGETEVERLNLKT